MITSTTAIAPEFLTEKRSAAIPLKKALPDVAPYRQTFPTITFCPESNLEDLGG